MRTANQRNGSSIMSGISQDVQAEFADEALQVQAGAVRDATMKQQELQLSQFLSALGIGGDVTKAAQSLLGQYAAAGADVTRSASANLGVAGDLMKGAESINLGRLQTGVAGANDVMKTMLARLGLGGDFISQANQLALARSGMGVDTLASLENLASNRVGMGLNTLTNVGNMQLGAGDMMTKLSAADNANMIAAMQMLQSMVNGGAGLFQGQQQLQLSKSMAEIDAFLKSMGLSGDFMSNYANWYQNSANGLNSTASLFAGAFPSLFGGYSSMSNSLIEAAMQPGFWERMLGQVVQGAAGAATSGLGDWLGGGKKKGGGN
jgi:hypothetical protein